MATRAGVGIVGRFLGNAVSEAAAFAAGVAIGPVLGPPVQEIRNETNKRYPFVPVEPGDAAEIVAEDVELRAWGVDEALQHGMDSDRFDALTNAVRNAPGIGELFEAYRRDLITDATFTHGLRKARLETIWDVPLKALKNRLLSLSDLANARQQGFVDTARQRRDTELQGFSADDADILFELSGLPLGVETMQQAVNRNLVDRATFDQAIREGHTKTKYTDLAYALRQPVLEASTYATLHLKGWITESEMNVGGALHGYTPEQMHLRYLSMGRPAAPGQMWSAIARGIDGPDGRPMDEAQFLKGIRQSDIRPEWGPMLYDLRFMYPPLFQLTRLVSANTITPAQAADWARKDRYAPEVVAALLKAWEAGGVATSKGLTVSDLTAEYEALTMSRTQYVNGLKELGYSQAAADGKVSVSDAKRQRLARNQLINRARVRYTGWKITRQAASDALRAASLTIGNANDLLTYWDAERDLNVHTLTEPQVVKAWKKSIMDRPTAVERLSELGLATADIDIRLDES